MVRNSLVQLERKVPAGRLDSHIGTDVICMARFTIRGLAVTSETREIDLAKLQNNWLLLGIKLRDKSPIINALQISLSVEGCM